MPSQLGLRDKLRAARYELAEAALPEVDAELLAAFVLGVGRMELHAKEFNFSPEQESEFKNLISERKSGIPEAVDIPANKVISLKPGGLHIMLIKVNKPINKGDSVPLTLTFETPDKRLFRVDVAAQGQEKAAGHSHH